MLHVYVFLVQKNGAGPEYDGMSNKYQRFMVADEMCAYSNAGNGVCDWWGNIKPCWFDGGDCCLPTRAHHHVRTYHFP